MHSRSPAGASSSGTRRRGETVESDAGGTLHAIRTGKWAILAVPDITSPAGRVDHLVPDRAESVGFVRTAFNGVWSNGITLSKGIVEAQSLSSTGQDAAQLVRRALTMTWRIAGFDARVVETTAHNVCGEDTVKSEAAVLRDWTSPLSFDTGGCMFSARVQRGNSPLALSPG